MFGKRLRGPACSRRKARLGDAGLSDGLVRAWGTSNIPLAGFQKVQVNIRNLTGPLCDEVNRHTDPQTLECPHFSTHNYLSIARPVVGFFVANNLHIFLQRTRTESPQISSTLNCHRYVKGGFTWG